MPSIKIVTYKAGETRPEVTVKVPASVFKLARKLIPHKAYTALEEQGIDLTGIDELIRSGEASGVLLEVEDHKKNEKTVISIEE
ncbi:MAG: hypothetical protein P8Y96_10420 [Desulfuromonadales bacterium]|jgi:hypothetical protein